MASVVRIGINGSHDHPANARLDDGGGAGRSSSVGATWLQRDVERGACGRLASAFGIAESLDFGVRSTCPVMPALANDCTGLGDHSPHQRIRESLTLGALGQPNRPAHEAQVVSETFVRTLSANCAHAVMISNPKD
jgi:hypothetical protein